ncbi:MAG: tetratricopeptide repeat protein, partial [Candidatus Thermoplasmatota archaeon]|nr:tetratricopeptide repeat protein [Candidatus Thermoplasmatota archaeon]
MKGRGIGIEKEDIVLLSLGLKSEKPRSLDDHIQIEELPDLLLISRGTLLRYISDLSRKEMIVKVGRDPFRISISNDGWERYQETLNELKGFILEKKRYCLEKPVALGYFMNNIRNPAVLIPLLRELHKRSRFDVPRFVLVKCGTRPESRYMSMLKELREDKGFDEDPLVDMTGIGWEQISGCTDHKMSIMDPNHLLLEGDLLRRQGRLKESLELFTDIGNRIKGIDGARWTFSEMGRIQTLRYMNSIEMTLEVIDEDLCFVSDSDQKGLLKRLKADILSDLGSYEEARSLYRSAVGHFRSTGSQNLLAICFNNLGVMFFRMGNLREAEYFWNNTMKISIENNIPWAKALALTNMADLNGRNGRFRKAKRMLKEARGIFASMGDMEGCSGVDFNMALVNVEEGKRASAIRHFDMAMEFPLRYDMKRRERREVLKARFREKGWELPFH